MGFVFSLELIITSALLYSARKSIAEGEEDAQETSIYNVWCVRKALDAKIAQTTSGSQVDLVLKQARRCCSGEALGTRCGSNSAWCSVWLFHSPRVSVALRCPDQKPPVEGKGLFLLTVLSSHSSLRGVRARIQDKNLEAGSEAEATPTRLPSLLSFSARTQGRPHPP